LNGLADAGHDQNQDRTRKNCEHEPAQAALALVERGVVSRIGVEVVRRAALGACRRRFSSIR